MDNMLKQFKDVAQLQQFAEAQYATILELNDKKIQLEKEVEHLKLMLSSSVPMINDSSKDLLGFGLDETRDDRIIAQIQLAKLKQIAMGREMTLEEAKKTETYSKILMSTEAVKKKEVEVNASVVDTTKLLELVTLK